MDSDSLGTDVTEREVNDSDFSEYVAEILVSLPSL